jgi:hypothetical protein
MLVLSLGPPSVLHVCPPYNRTSTLSSPSSSSLARLARRDNIKEHHIEAIVVRWNHTVV